MTSLTKFSLIIPFSKASGLHIICTHTPVLLSQEISTLHGNMHKIKKTMDVFINMLRVSPQVV